MQVLVNELTYSYCQTIVAFAPSMAGNTWKTYSLRLVFSGTGSCRSSKVVRTDLPTDLATYALLARSGEMACHPQLEGQRSYLRQRCDVVA